VFTTQNLQWYLLLFHNLLKNLSYVEELISLFGIAIATESKFIQWQPHPVTGHSACSLKRIQTCSNQLSFSNFSIFPHANEVNCNYSGLARDVNSLISPFIFIPYIAKIKQTLKSSFVIICKFSLRNIPTLMLVKFSMQFLLLKGKCKEHILSLVVDITYNNNELTKMAITESYQKQGLYSTLKPLAVKWPIALDLLYWGVRLCISLIG